MKQIIIDNKAVKRINKKYPLIHKEDIVSDYELETGEWVSFFSQGKQFLGYGYLGVQNKGYGWVLSFKKEQPITLEYLKDCLARAITKRSSFFNDPQTTAFRILNGEGDNFGGLTIDWYDNYLVLSWYNLSIYQHQKEIVELLSEIVPDVKGIYEKIRFKSENLPESSFVWGSEAPEPLIVKENGVNYATYLNEGLMTGIFLDQKEVRNYLVDGFSSGQTLLNTFSYTGAFSVAAAVGGASHTTSVDLAKRSIEKTEEQFRVNGIDPETQTIFVMDVFNYFKYAEKKGFSFDVVVLDPPSFARNKKKTFSVAKDYGKLTTEAVRLINKNGKLIASTNAANVNFDKFEKMVEKGIKEAGRGFKQQRVFRLPSDFAVSNTFSEGNYLKVLVYEII
ncbi:class I SAM-dependent rRNA methyltransferase [Vagococcus carniphilus]|uniref:Class I SAM-dependent rRNA methyltransferase n=1 Tax=Vagococcus carniphilus TaxID=218144 RepID=A0AAW8U4Q8_9ENTE|nr:class I SAM-dependent rRNA methyltransferase [Vagococcus carniphilus]MDT2831526.1 class I SAM-dependent rRNA methyltransferase [Vagococcus carniphilus]MDT2832809.1 class I SAM-dependent rRNA methyltransferase [Vagococcus carniphilus]MDT2840248.1 class I SAM-dependent rRNA methyltransferase [Vagococcus carniphilus]MDT2848472.1 class I SAM-dependent rRNA methyltransferase [Vagococcus carniphilus]MDT2854929.1 class I SAM-dependent rRNA methyltransferase [Vagococcus carniphilus]